MSPSPFGCGLGPWRYSLSRPQRVYLCYGPVTRSLPWGDLVDRLQSFSFHHLCYPNYGALTSTPAGLSPAEHASLRWTHNRTCFWRVITDAGEALMVPMLEHLRDMTRIPSTRISAVVSDVDGTLVTDDKVLTERARSAVAKLHATGIIFGVISARPPRGLLMLLGPLQITAPVIGFNGGVLTDPDMTIITEHLLTPEIARHAVDLLDTHGAQV